MRRSNARVTPKEVAPAGFRFESSTHTYTDLATGEALPHITRMLEATGWADSTWFNAQGAARGTAVHALTKTYDLGGLSETIVVEDRLRGYFLAHQEAIARLRPEWSEIEEAHVHPVLRFGGRPDRVGVVLGLQSVVDEKTGGAAKADAIQTALQAILVAAHHPLPARRWQRMAWYLKRNGKVKVVRFDDPHDFTVANGIIRETCR